MSETNAETERLLSLQVQHALAVSASVVKLCLDSQQQIIMVTTKVICDQIEKCETPHDIAQLMACLRLGLTSLNEESEGAENAR